MKKEQELFNDLVKEYNLKIVTPLLFVKLVELAIDCKVIKSIERKHLKKIKKQIDYKYDVNVQLKNYIKSINKDFDEEEYDNFIYRCATGYFK